MAAGPTAGKPAHETMTVRNSTTYGHHVPPIASASPAEPAPFALFSGKASIRAPRHCGHHPPEGDSGRHGYSSRIIGATANCRTDVSRLPRVMVASVITSEAGSTELTTNG